jgi:predicted DNA-binding transcriptional regulator AlpA
MDDMLNEPSRFEPLWSITTTAEYLGVATKTLYSWRCHRVGPPSYRVGGLVRYRPAEVCAWLDRQARAS